MRAWIVIVLLLPLGSFSFAQESFTGAMNRIAIAKVYAFGGIGFAGTTSEGEVDFRVIMAQPPKVALDAFGKLCATNNPQTKAYALAGIRKLDKGRFEALRLSLRPSGQQVQIEEGCIISEHSLKDIADRLDSGNYDLWIG